jgi:CHASE2 domain-containing sensor protein
MRSSDANDTPHLSEVVDRFEAAWQRGQQPALGDYLPADGAQRLTVLIELVHVDLERRLKAGEAVRVETYLKRYPELAEDQAVVLDLLTAEFALRRRRQPELPVAEFVQRFPHHGAAIQQRLEQQAFETGAAVRKAAQLRSWPQQAAALAKRWLFAGAFFWRPAWRGLWLGLLCAVITWLLAQTAPLRGLEDWVHDAYLVHRGPRSTQARIVLIGIDDDSLARLDKESKYLSPQLAEVVRYAHEQQAAVIGVDLLIPESQSDLPDFAMPGARGDAIPMGQAVLEAGNVVLAQWRAKDQWERPLKQWQLKALVQPDGTDLGFIDCTEDDDQVVRRQQLLVPDGDQAVPHFALALFAKARGAKVQWDPEPGAIRVVRLGGDTIPLDDEQKLRINYVGPPGTFAPIPFHEVLAAARANRPMPEMQDAVVLIGVTASSKQDYHTTPYARAGSAKQPLMAGTELHAHILATLVDRAYIHTLPRPALFGLLLVLGAGLGTALVRLRPAWGALVTVALLFLWVALGLALFAYGNWQIDVVALLLLCLLVYAAAAAFRHWLVPTPAAAVPSPGLRTTRIETPTPAPTGAPSTVVPEVRPAAKSLRIPGYDILQELGQGGMGVVYKARQIMLRRIVALKMLRAGGNAGPDLLARFRVEAEAVARMQHPHIVQVYDYGEWRAGDVSPPMPYFVLEFVDGGNLSGKLRGQPLPVRQAVDLMVMLGRAVQHAHQRGVIHRDLKPANVLLTAEGVPKIADFGLAKMLDESSDLTQTGALLGTPSYMAPEQAAGQSRLIGPATDVYALGAILYELLTGRPPFKGDTILETLDQVRFRAPAPLSQLQPGLPPELEAICLKCLEKEPARRYPTAEALVQSLVEAYLC